MPAEVETTLRGPEAYALARRALDEMQGAGVWPTPLNFELWLHFIGEPDGSLGREIKRTLAAAEPFTDATADKLASEHLPRARLTEEIRDAGRVLDAELASVASAVSKAHQAQADYGKTLDEAASEMEGGAADGQLQTIVSDLTTATRKVQRDNESLEHKLQASTHEVSRLREHLEQVRRDAMTDALTLLANRKAFDEHLLACTEQAKAGKTSLILALLDIDHFKHFNDTWGHQTGDQVLRYVASVLNRAAGGARFAARYGGEEFALIFPRESVPVVEAALEEVRRDISSRSLRRRSTNDELGAITLSAGYAAMRADDEATTLIERADAALYLSKRNGRNCISNADQLTQAA